MLQMEIRAFLESVHGMQVERVSTINYQGKKKRHRDKKGRPFYTRTPDWKKAYVIFKAPPDVQRQWEEQAAAGAAARDAALRKFRRGMLRATELPPLTAGAAAAAAARGSQRQTQQQQGSRPEGGRVEGEGTAQLPEP